MSSRRNDLLQRALLESEMKYGSQGAALRSLLSELAGSYSRTRRTNASTARGIVAATQQARPEMAQAFDQALGSSQAARSALGVDTADPQAQAYTRRVGEQRANALNALTDRATRAQEGQAYANQQARAEYMGGKAKIQGQLADLLRESGQATATRYADLLDEERKVALDEARLGETQRNNQAQESVADRRADIAASSAARQARGRSKPKWATPKDHASAKDQIDEAAQWISNLGRNMSSSQIRALLATGGALADAEGNETKVPQISKDYVNAAYDLVKRKGLSQANVRALHRRRLRIRDLGYPTLPPPRGRSTSAPSSNYQQGPARRGAGRG